ncbi:MAG: trypsin-like peptidase domain-containing protein [Phycisphaerae bacterium]|jgi:serine protease Do|nr:trypsin-like peptidase domain-containing protein [Phycisphaerae bacterium]
MTRKRIAIYLAGVVMMFCAIGAVGAQEARPVFDKVRGMDFRAVVRKAKAKVFPAVVYVRCLSESHESGKKITQEVSGSGVIISASGEVMTNWHVVDKATEVRCLTFEGKAMDAKVVGKDKDTDLALLQMKLPKGAKPQVFAKFGDSDRLVEGDFVMAMGAPWGLNRSVSIGIISCTSRYLEKNSEYSSWLQTDAAINPGNSGGPLVNTAGEIVGINTRGGGTNLGFSVPAKTVQFVADQLRKNGKVDWSWTGLQLQPLRDFNHNQYYKGKDGVIVSGTDPDSPARRAGLKLKDRILKINGQAIAAMWEEDLPAVRKLVGLLPKGKGAKIEIKRDDKLITLTMTPREKGKVEGEELDCPRWDLSVKSINQFDNPNLYFHRKKGVYVFAVKYPGNANTAGLRVKDVIIKIGKDKIATLDEIKKIHKTALDNIKKNHKVLVVVLRGGLMRQVLLDFSRDYERE